MESNVHEIILGKLVREGEPHELALYLDDDAVAPPRKYRYEIILGMAMISPQAVLYSTQLDGWAEQKKNGRR